MVHNFYRTFTEILEDICRIVGELGNFGEKLGKFYRKFAAVLKKICSYFKENCRTFGEILQKLYGKIV